VQNKPWYQNLTPEIHNKFQTTRFSINISNKVLLLTKYRLYLRREHGKKEFLFLPPKAFDVGLYPFRRKRSHVRQEEGILFRGNIISLQSCRV